MINPSMIAVNHDAPQKDGEPVFLTPWEARIFAIVTHLAQSANIEWDDFRDNLIAQLADTDHPNAACNMDEGTHYYRSWLAAAEALLDKNAICTMQDLEGHIHTLGHHDADGKLSASGQIPEPASQH